MTLPVRDMLRMLERIVSRITLVGAAVVASWDEPGEA